MLMTLDRSFTKSMSMNASMEMSVFGHQSKSRTTVMYMSGSHTIKVRDQTVDLRETKNLYHHLMILFRLNRDIDQKNAFGNYEFTLSPRALFAPD